MNIKKLENELDNIYFNGYYYNQISEGEGRIIYDISDMVKYPVILKINKNNFLTRKEGLKYQCFVENFIYNKIGNEFNLLAKVYNSDDLSENYVFMEKCNVLDESFFSFFDIRDEKTYSKYITDKYKLNIDKLRKDIQKELKNKLNNEYSFNNNFKGINIEEIPNENELIEVSLYFQLSDFINLIEEIEDVNIDKEKIIDKIENYHLDIVMPKLFKILLDKFKFSGYDLFLGLQWGISEIDYSFRLIDYGDGLNSEKVYNHIINNFS